MLLEQPLEHEQIRIIRGGRTSITIIVAVHSTALGPAIGGCRMRHYPTWQDGLTDALRLSAAMTDKCSLAGIDHGGGKTVAVLPSGPIDAARRTDLVLDIADVIASLLGSYLTGPDVGTGPDDMRIIYERTGYAFCRPASAGGSGDSAQATAHGVLAALLAGAEHVFGTQSLTGRSIGVLGLGNVGRYLARLLHERGAELTISDINEQRRADARTLGARWHDPISILTADLDILVPAAVGGVLTRAVAPRLGCRLIVGPANNQLATDDVADLLDSRGIVWVPDILAGAGGIVHAINIEQHGMTEAQVAPRIAGIGDTVARVLAQARTTSLTPLVVARHQSRERIRTGRRRGSSPPA